MRSTTSELNWSGTVTYTAERVERPSTLDEAAEIVARSPRVHGLGTRHSFNDVADAPGVLLDLTGIPTDLVVDTAAGTATMGAGTRYGVVAPDLDTTPVVAAVTAAAERIRAAAAPARGTVDEGVHA